MSAAERRSARRAVGAAFILIAVGLFTPIENWPVHGFLLGLVFIALSVRRVPLGYLARRFGLFSIPVLSLALSIPLASGFRGGWDTAATIAARSTLTFAVALWLAHTVTLDQLIACLRQFGVPATFTALLQTTARYGLLLADELSTMQIAFKARSFGDRRRTAWGYLPQMLGMLVIRSMNRAERVHNAMLARGWNGGASQLDGSSSGPTIAVPIGAVARGGDRSEGTTGTENSTQIVH